MKVKQKDSIVVFTSKSDSKEEFAQKIMQQYNQYKDLNIIVNFEGIDLLPKDFVSFEELAQKHRSHKKSFVIVGSIDFDEIDNDITVVPTLLEANDIIQLEEIERDLGF